MTIPSGENKYGTLCEQWPFANGTNLEVSSLLESVIHVQPCKAENRDAQLYTLTRYHSCKQDTGHGHVTVVVVMRRGRSHVQVRSGSEAPARGRRNGEIPTPLRDLIPRCPT